MIRFELKKEIASGRLFVYLSIIIVLYIIYFFSKGQALNSEQSIQFIKNAWQTVIGYIFPIIISFLCTDIFTSDYSQGHLKDITLVVKNKSEVWFRKCVATLFIVIILLVYTILLGFILSLFLPSVPLFVGISSYFIFFLNTFLNLLPITLLFILISVVNNKPICTIMVSSVVYILCIVLDKILKQYAFTPFASLFSASNKPLLSIGYTIVLVLINIIYVNKKEIKK